MHHNYFLFSCDHEGNILRHKKGFEKMIHMAHSEYKGCKNNFLWHHGDPVEGITMDDPRYHPDCIDPNSSVPAQQVKNAIKNLKPIAHLILGMNESNHPLKLWRYGNITKMICNSDKFKKPIPYGTYAAKLVARDSRGQLMYKSYHTHGRKSINSAADDPKRRIVNMRLTLKRHLKHKMGDCILMSKAHVHKLIICGPESELYMKDDGDKVTSGHTMDGINQTDEFIHPDHRTYVCAGSFLKLYGDGVSGYAEIAEYDPIELGFAIARFRDRRLVGVDAIYLD